MRRLASLALALSVSSVAHAAEGDGEAKGKAGGKVGLGGGEAKAEGDASSPGGGKETRKEKLSRAKQAEKKKPWLRRWEPQRHLGELGISGGLFLPSEQHDLYDPRTRPQKPLWRVGGDVSFRAAYFPLRALGVEAEFSGNPIRVRTTNDDPAFVYGFRGHVIAQVPVTRINPFLLGGYGLLGVRSSIFVLGNDIDPAFHYGGGVKIAITRMMSARVEARQIVSASAALQDSGTYHVQLLAGLSLVLGRKINAPPLEPLPEDPDRDHDGILNEPDQCPDTPGIAPTGCPDTDGDTFVDNVDACVEIPGVEPSGCPAPDTDGDKIADRDDQCVFLPENLNEHMDDDGCPEQLPPKLVQFNGVIAGIVFDFNKATIRPESKPKLDEAVAALQEFPGVKIKIVGHTDNIGTEEFNLELSRKRAESVKQYLVDAGVDAQRIDTEGKGPNAPIADNSTEEGQAKNRRIEFEITENVATEVAR